MPTHRLTIVLGLAGVTLLAGCDSADRLTRPAAGGNAMSADPTTAAVPSWTITDLDPYLPSNLRSFAYGLNDRGHIVGYYQVALTKYRAFRFTGAGATVLPLLPGGTTSAAYGVNNNGIVVGMADEPGTPSTATLWTSSNVAVRVPLPNGALVGGYSAAYAINPKGTIVGTYTGQDHNSHPFRTLASGVSTDITPPGGNGIAYAIDGLGQIAGAAPRATMWNAAAVPIGLGTLGGGYEVASAIQGQTVVGWAITSAGIITGFKWTLATGMQDMGISQFENFARGLSPKLRIVGEYQKSSGGTPLAFTKLNNVMTTLGGLAPGAASEADAVNTCGQIVGQALDGSGKSHAVVWKLLPATYCDP